MVPSFSKVPSETFGLIWLKEADVKRIWKIVYGSFSEPALEIAPHPYLVG